MNLTSNGVQGAGLVAGHDAGHNAGHDAGHNAGHDAGHDTAAGVLSALRVYPVKSMKGIAVSSWPVGATGLVGDRRWLVVDIEGRQITQRESPRLCLLTPALEPLPCKDRDEAEFELSLRAPGAGVMTVAQEGGKTTRVRVWDDEVEAYATTPEVDEWLSDFLERGVRLVRFARAELVAGRQWQRVAFPDSLPFLLIGQASLDDLNARLASRGEATVNMNRFRPNFVVAGSGAYAEDGWQRIWIGALDFSVRQPCGRCVITTIEQATAKVGREPLATLAGYRTAQGKAMFGQKLIHLGPGTARVGDAVSVRELRPEGERLTFKHR